jgi:hypothetical protein
MAAPLTGSSLIPHPPSHGVSANASKTKPAKLLAVFVVDTNETELTMTRRMSLRPARPEDFVY